MDDIRSNENQELENDGSDLFKKNVCSCRLNSPEQNGRNSQLNKSTELQLYPVATPLTWRTRNADGNKLDAFQNKSLR